MEDASLLAKAKQLHEEAETLRLRGEYSRASEVCIEVLAIREAELGSDHPDLAETLNLLGLIHKAMGKYEKAEQFYQQALSSLEKTLGESHPNVASMLQNLAMLYFEQGKFKEAELRFLRARDIKKESPGWNRPDLAITLTSLGGFYQSRGLYLEAENNYEQALAIWKEVLDYVARTLNNIGTLRFQQSRYEEAEEFYKRSLNILEQVLGIDHPTVATAVANIAMHYSRLSRYEEAEVYYQRALDIRKTKLGEEHPDVSSTLNNMGAYYLDQGEYRKAENCFRQALQISEKMQHPTVPTRLNNLGRVYSEIGQYQLAEQHYKRALDALRAQTLDHPDIATCLSNIGMLSHYQAKYEEARAWHNEALKIRQKLGDQHVDVITSINNLAMVADAMEEYPLAESLFNDSLRRCEIREGQGQALPPRLKASLLSNLASLYRDQNLYEQAKHHYQEAWDLWEAAMGSQHPDGAIILNNLAFLHAAQGQIEQALPLLQQALAISEKSLHQLTTESRIGFLLAATRHREDKCYSLNRSYKRYPPIRHLTLSTALLRKGRAADQGAQTANAILKSLTILEQRDKFSFLQEQCGRLSFLDRNSERISGYREKRIDAQTRIDLLEKELADASETFRNQLIPKPEEIVARVAKALPQDSVLIEIVAYRSSPFEAVSRNDRGLREQDQYLAFLLFADERIEIVELGQATMIDATARLFLRVITAPERKYLRYLKPAQDLYHCVMEPIIPFLEGRTNLYISTDGLLNLIPFAALHDGQNFMLDTYIITYLTSGRDLLREKERKAAGSEGGSMMLLAGPRFNEGIPPLAGSITEAHGVRRLFASALPDERFLLGEKATKKALFQVEHPRILHIATHAEHQKDLIDSGNPLTRAALLFAGARHSHNAEEPTNIGLDDGRATALELSRLDLHGTELVVLSACDTGVGEVKIGQGVFGLRRAFFIAGAETLVVSLWHVEDESTSDLMLRYYENLQLGQGRTVALVKAARTLKKMHDHPYYWASFITLGNSDPLRNF